MAAVRTLLVTGASGAGRTTVATAVATAAAGAGRRTLLLTPDTVAVEPAPPGLTLGRVDPAAAFREGALDAQSRIGALLTLLGAAPLDPEELTELPGADPLALLRALRHARVLPDPDGDAAGPSPWDLVVVDLPAVRDAVRLLALPEQLRRYLWRLLPEDRQAARALRPVLAQLAGVPMPAEWAYDAAARADRELAAVQAVIEDPGTAVAVVVDPGARGREALRTARTGLALYGHRLAAVVANRLLPTGSADPFLAGLSGQQQAELKGVAESCAADGVPLVELAHLGREPRTPAEFAELGSVPISGGPERREEPWTVEERLAAEGHFLWVLPLPGASREGLDLVRRGDELVVDAGGFRRIVPLPSALRRCTVQGAALREGSLRVRFTPDPALWPR
ncbi:arsenite efflux ATP-binding protein ArsA [Actinacidiphila yanglinensis]|uniref:Arsenite efflux ATP-binding protein ArsA n=1 Tax=Actinacidiphila yanglinensis TaxID=310779 RepID=A0A1H5TF58_9ACTN|nr:ArsA-related P-loop ATPase [Actinacidiphila yanglinensis]SEF61482.1 arsenite efflux ATP-binding protein ArsA [Actinacidiphila yanglinensis]